MFSKVNSGTFCGMHFMFANANSKHERGGLETDRIHEQSKESMQI